MTLEDGTISRNVGEELSIYTELEASNLA